MLLHANGPDVRTPGVKRQEDCKHCKEVNLGGIRTTIYATIIDSAGNSAYTTV